MQKTNLAQNVADSLHIPLQEAKYRQFADGEINVVLEKSEQYANKTVVIIQSTGRPVNEHLLGVAFLAQELKNVGAKKVIAVIPYFGYARQERSTIENKPGHAAVIAKMFEVAGIDELIAVELHDKKLIKLFSIPVHNLSARSIIAEHIKDQCASLSDVCLVAPDKGATTYVEDVAHKIGVGTLIFSKERFATDQTRIVGISGDCQGTIGIVIDDIIATGGTAINVCDLLPGRGFQNVYGYFVHPVLAGNVVERLKASCFDTIYVSNTLPLPLDAQNKPFIKQFDVSSIIVTQLQKIVG